MSRLLQALKAVVDTYLSTPKCPHPWRPARTSKGPARYCYRCDITEQLTEAEFYAQFGRTSRTFYAEKGQK